ncbi:hypothetical protein PUNSTDRAFT_144023 [Punctularia strigosozonata HHB-11173 SS5]|uniref:uncharacterized protein n=1 Tax=Punctularia strigosozonata (strain HHB-11173) TaxID=741275 RepID=UPI000441699E|nr:uncharacterized protein PUNSTDRAFT_144023 [Punctularia strigosozonata HHB-11173 SS5]EIN08424.1 hypothetical protein PUNSTDRAFT_144023 [Punctularia strigosozonata HHB-11173 SS5]
MSNVPQPTISLARIPDEVLLEVLLRLPRSSQKACMASCRLLHTITLPILFRRIGISFGSLEENGFESDDVLASEKNLWEAEKTRSTDILKHISHTPHFAYVCRTLVIYAYAGMYDGELTGSLLPAVCMMTQLRSVSWVGHLPPTARTLIDGLVANCHKITEIRLPNMGWEMNHPRWFRNLTSFSVQSQMGVDYALQETADEALLAIIPFILSIIEINSTILRRISIPEISMRWVPNQVAERLTHLTVWNCEHFDYFAGVFMHGDSIVSLALIEVTGNDIYDLLRHYPSALPKLTDFKLSLLDPMEYKTEDTLAICHFIRGRWLQRLDIDAPGSSLGLILDVLPEFPGLTALGLDAPGFFRDEDVELLADSIPPNLVALHIQHPWEGLSLESYEIQPLLEKLASMPRLHFLQWQDPVPSSCMVAEALGLEIPTLEYLGLGSTFWRIIREDHSSVKVSRIRQSRLMLDVFQDPNLQDERWLLEWRDFQRIA